MVIWILGSGKILASKQRGEYMVLMKKGSRFSKKGLEGVFERPKKIGKMHQFTLY